MNMIVGIPTLNRYDLLENCIGSIFNGSIKPTKVIVIDNGGKYQATRPNVEVHSQRRNLGVAASWNVLHRISIPAPIIICNDDIEFGKDSLAVLMGCSDSFVVPAEDEIGWSCFKQSHSLWNTVGPYDETFYPAYFEDNDYRYRMKLAGIYATHVPCGIKHTKSSTVSKMSDYEIHCLNKAWKNNEEYFAMKWGGLPYQETYIIPFNKEDNKNETFSYIS